MGRQARDVLAEEADRAASAATRPVIRLNSVDLPEPFGPITRDDDCPSAPR